MPYCIFTSLLSSAQTHITSIRFTLRWFPTSTQLPTSPSSPSSPRLSVSVCFQFKRLPLADRLSALALMYAGTNTAAMTSPKQTLTASLLLDSLHSTSSSYPSFLSFHFLSLSHTSLFTRLKVLLLSTPQRILFMSSAPIPSQLCPQPMRRFPLTLTFFFTFPITSLHLFTFALTYL